MTGQKLSLRAFAAKRAATGAVTAGLVNALVLYASLSDLPEVPIFALVAEDWKHSLIGALIPRAALISLLVTVVTVWATVRSRSAGEVSPPIASDVAWFRPTLRLALYRSVLALLLVIGIALVLRYLVPTYTAVNFAFVVVLVALFAGLLAYIMSYTAVLKTGRRTETGHAG